MKRTLLDLKNAMKTRCIWIDDIWTFAYNYPNNNKNNNKNKSIENRDITSKSIEILKKNDKNNAVWRITI